MWYAQYYVTTKNNMSRPASRTGRRRPRWVMGKSAGILREFLDSKAGVAFGKALGEASKGLLDALLEGSSAPTEPVTSKPNPPIPVTKEVEH